jgi:type I restriction enzyme S subunit
MIEWQSSTIKNVSIIGDGAHASLKRVSDGVLYLSSKNFKPDGISLDNCEYISEETYNKYFKENSKSLTKHKTGDILLSIIGTIGAPYIAKKNDKFGLSSSVSIIRPKKINSDYLYYWIKTPMFQDSIRQIKSGVAQSFLSLKMIGSLPISYPKTESDQQKIAKILSNYDDLIENNLKRIELLEEFTKQIYKEWFLRFNINNKKLKIDSKSSLPFGWIKKELKGFFPINTGKKDANIKSENGRYPFFTCSQKTLRTDSFSFDTDAIILAGNGVFNVKYFRGKFEAYQRNYVLIPYDSGYLFLLFLHISYHLKQITHGSKGSVIKYITKDMIEKINFVDPPKETLNQFNKKIIPLFDLIENLNNQNKFLKESRDILLPRLMSGMINIKNLDIVV